MSIAEKLLRSRPLNHISWLLIAVCTLVHLTGCASKDNDYSKFYQDRTGAEITHWRAYSGRTQILTTTNAAYDTRDLYRKGYALVGVSEFQGQSLTDGALKFQAKQVGADIVLRSRAYLRTDTSAPGFPTSMSLHQRLNVPICPVTYRIYQYEAGFFRKGPPSILGALYGPTPPEIRKKLAVNMGVYVFILRNQSPAFKANMMEGDVILKMDGEDVKSQADMREKLDKLAGHKVEVEIWRNGQVKTISVQLNRKS